MPRYILNHPEWGVLVGEWLGRCFWTQIDDTEPPAVITFYHESAAIKARSVVEMLSSCDVSLVHPLKVDTEEEFATEAQCVAAGAKPWTQKIKA